MSAASLAVKILRDAADEISDIRRHDFSEFVREIIASSNALEREDVATQAELRRLREALAAANAMMCGDFS